MASKKRTKKSVKNNMMNNEVINQDRRHTIDLTTIEGDGTFQCPKCKTTISPDDETEDIYQILDTKVVDDVLTELVISCGTCGTVITLTGFQNSVEL